MSKEHEQIQEVFVVTHGTYSDYKIIGVFSTRQKAKAFIVTAQGPEDAFPEHTDRMGIEVYDLDEWFNRKLHVFEVVMKISTREIESIEFEENGELWKNEESFTTDGGAMIVWRGVRAKSVEHVVKVANEKISAMIASGVPVSIPGKDGIWELRNEGKE